MRVPKAMIEAEMQANSAHLSSRLGIPVATVERKDAPPIREMMKFWDGLQNHAGEELDPDLVSVSHVYVIHNVPMVAMGYPMKNTAPGLRAIMWQVVTLDFGFVVYPDPYQSEVLEAVTDAEITTATWSGALSEAVVPAILKIASVTPEQLHNWFRSVCGQFEKAIPAYIEKEALA